MADVIIRTTLQGVDGVVAGLGSIQSAAQNISNKFASSAKSLEDFGNSLRSAGINISLLTAPLAAVGAEAVVTAGKFEQTNIALNTLVGNTKDAHQFLNELKNFAATTPFTFVGIADASKRLIAMGFEARAIIPIMTAVGNATSALGSGQEGINRITYALGQMRNSAVLNSRDMYQLQQAFVDGWGYIAKATGKSIAEVRDLTAKGMMDAKEAVVDILLGMANDPKFKNMMEAQSRTLLGVWSNFKDRLGYVLIDIGDAIAKALNLKAMVNVAIDALQRLETWWAGLNEVTQKWVVYIGTAAIAAGPLLIVIGQMSLGVSAVLKGMSAFVGIIGSPMLLAIGAVVVAIGYLITTTDSWGTVIASVGAMLKTLWEIGKNVFTTLTTSMSAFVQALSQAVSGHFTDAWNSLKSAGSDIVDQWSNIPGDIHKTWTVDFSNNQQFVDSVVKDITNTFKYGFDTIGFGTTYVADMFDNMGETGTFSFKSIEEAMTHFSEQMKKNKNVVDETTVAQRKHMVAVAETAQKYAIGLDPALAYEETINNLRESLQLGLINQYQFNTGIMKAGQEFAGVEPKAKKFKDSLDGSESLGSAMEYVKNKITGPGAIISAVQEFSNQFGKSVADILSDGGKLRDKLSNIFKEMAKNIIASIVSIMAQWAAYKAVVASGVVSPGDLAAAGIGGAVKSAGGSIVGNAAGGSAAVSSVVSGGASVAASTGATTAAGGAAAAGTTGVATGGAETATAGTAAASSGALLLAGLGVIALGGIAKVTSDHAKNKAMQDAFDSRELSFFHAAINDPATLNDLGTKAGVRNTAIAELQNFPASWWYNFLIYEHPTVVDFLKKLGISIRKDTPDLFNGLVEMAQNAQNNVNLFGNPNAGKQIAADNILKNINTTLGFAAGGSFVVDTPSFFLAGEAGREHVQITPENAKHTPSGPNVIFQAQTFVASPIERAKLAKEIAAEMRRWA